jgi:hypothetical protein
MDHAPGADRSIMPVRFAFSGFDVDLNLVAAITKLHGFRPSIRAGAGYAIQESFTVIWNWPVFVEGYSPLQVPLKQARQI